MRWNGTVAQSSTRTIATALSAAKTAHRPARRRLDIAEAIADAAERLDDVRPELGAQAPHADVDDVRAGIERDPPDLAQELLAGAHHRRAGHEVLQEHEFARRKRDRAGADVRF